MDREKIIAVLDKWLDINVAATRTTRDRMQRVMCEDIADEIIKECNGTDPG
jgi:hypothetical protein